MYNSLYSNGCAFYILANLGRVVKHNHEQNFLHSLCLPERYILLTKTAAAQNEVALNFYRVRGLYLLVVVLAATIITDTIEYQQLIFTIL